MKKKNKGGRPKGPPTKVISFRVPKRFSKKNITILHGVIAQLIKEK